MARVSVQSTCAAAASCERTAWLESTATIAEYHPPEDAPHMPIRHGSRFSASSVVALWRSHLTAAFMSCKPAGNWPPGSREERCSTCSIAYPAAMKLGQVNAGGVPRRCGPPKNPEPCTHTITGIFSDDESVHEVSTEPVAAAAGRCRWQRSLRSPTLAYTCVDVSAPGSVRSQIDCCCCAIDLVLQNIIQYPVDYPRRPGTVTLASQCVVRRRRPIIIAMAVAGARRVVAAPPRLSQPNSM